MATSEFSDKKFLVVDDFADMRSVLRNILRSMEVSQIDLACNGQEAISRLEKRRYDVILCDYNLGEGRDGQQVLEEARYRQLIGIDTIFIMITAENTRDMVMAAVEHTPDTYLTKPFTRELLQTRLNKLFGQKANLAIINRHLLVKDYAAAITELDALIAKAPKNVSELLKLEAEICLSATRYDDAMVIYQDVLSERDVRWARLGIGKVLFYKKQYAQAEENFTNLLALDNNLLEAYDYLAKTQMALGRFQDAEKTLTTAVRISPRGFKRQCLLADVALTNGNTELAEVAYTHANSIGRHSIHNHPSIMTGLAKSLTANGKHPDALKIAGQIQSTFPTHHEAIFYEAAVTALIKSNQKDHAAAEEALKIAEQAMGESGIALSSTLGLEMVKTYSQLGAHEKAKRILEKTIANNHDDEDFLTEVKQVCHAAGIAEDGIRTIREIQQEIVKTNNAGVQLIKQGQFDAAIRLLQQAADDMPGNKTVNLNAAKALIMKMEKLGATAAEVQQVRGFVERVQRVAPDDWRLSDVVSHLQKLANKV